MQNFKILIFGRYFLNYEKTNNLNYNCSIASKTIYLWKEISKLYREHKDQFSQIYRYQTYVIFGDLIVTEIGPR